MADSKSTVVNRPYRKAYYPMYKQPRTNLATKAWVNSQLKKHRDYGLMNSNISNTDWQPSDMQVHHIGLDIAAGSNTGDRDGHEVFYEDIEMQFQCSNSLTTARLHMRFVVVEDKMPQIGLPNIGLFTPESNSNTFKDWSPNGQSLQMVKSINSERYNVLYDFRKELGPATTYNNFQDELLFKRKFKINKVLSYNTKSGYDKITPAMYILYWVCDSSQATSFTANSVQFKVVYHEKFLK